MTDFQKRFHNRIAVVTKTGDISSASGPASAVRPPHSPGMVKGRRTLNVTMASSVFQSGASKSHKSGRHTPSALQWSTQLTPTHDESLDEPASPFMGSIQKLVSGPRAGRGSVETVSARTISSTASMLPAHPATSDGRLQHTRDQPSPRQPALHRGRTSPNPAAAPHQPPSRAHSGPGLSATRKPSARDLHALTQHTGYTSYFSGRTQSDAQPAVSSGSTPATNGAARVSSSSGVSVVRHKVAQPAKHGLGSSGGGQSWENIRLLDSVDPPAYASRGRKGHANGGGMSARHRGPWEDLEERESQATGHTKWPANQPVHKPRVVHQYRRGTDTHTATTRQQQSSAGSSRWAPQQRAQPSSWGASVGQENGRYGRRRVENRSDVDYDDSYDEPCVDERRVVGYGRRTGTTVVAGGRARTSPTNARPRRLQGGMGGDADRGYGNEFTPHAPRRRAQNAARPHKGRARTSPSAPPARRLQARSRGDSSDADSGSDMAGGRSGGHVPRRRGKYANTARISRRQDAGMAELDASPAARAPRGRGRRARTVDTSQAHPRRIRSRPRDDVVPASPLTDSSKADARRRNRRRTTGSGAPPASAPSFNRTRHIKQRRANVGATGGSSSSNGKMPRPVSDNGIVYKPYTLEDYRELPQVAPHFGGLGPDFENPEYKKKRARQDHMRKYAHAIRLQNAQRILKARSRSTPPSPAKSDKARRRQPSKRERALQFAARIPKPKPRPPRAQPDPPPSEVKDASARAAGSAPDADRVVLDREHERRRSVVAAMRKQMFGGGL